jgi:hypothetical protein
MMANQAFAIEFFIGLRYTIEGTYHACRSGILAFPEVSA